MDFSNLQSRISSSAAYFPPHRTQLHPRMHYSSPVPKPSSLSSSSSSYQSRAKQRWWILGAALLALPFLYYLFTAARGTHLSSRFRTSRPKGYGIVIHAGLSGSRVNVFEYLNEGRFPLVGFDGKSSVSIKVRPGLREFAADPEGAGRSLLQLLDFARQRVPRAEWRDTKVRLMDTGGLGRVPLKTRQAILESCRWVLRSSGFLFRDEWASSITGQEKGIYAWVAANYALGTLGGDPSETMGVIELGGASTQITFVPREQPPMEFSRMLKLPGVTYNLYSHSMLHFGQEGAWEQLNKLQNSRTITTSSTEASVMNPCIPKGYSQTSDLIIAMSTINKKFLADSGGNFSACRSNALALLQKEQGRCSHRPCGILSSFMSELHGKRLSVESFLYTSELFPLVPRASLLDLEAAGRHYCEVDWNKLREEHVGIDEADLLRYCFSSAYIVALLHDGLGIPMDDKRIGFTNQAGSAPRDWTLGAFILQTVVEPGLKTDNLGQIVGNNAVTYLSLFAVLLLAILTVFFVSKWRKPQLKTVYDLEKGHYIVTHMPR